MLLVNKYIAPLAQTINIIVQKLRLITCISRAVIMNTLARLMKYMSPLVQIRFNCFIGVLVS